MVKLIINNVENSTEISALVLVGGKGTRMRQSNLQELQDWPKPLVRIRDEKDSSTMLDDILQKIIDTKITSKFLFLTSTDPESQNDLVTAHIKAFYGPGKTTETDKPIFSTENTPLGTAGAIYLGLEKVKDKTILVTPSDIKFPFYKLKEIPLNHPGRESVIWMVTSHKNKDIQQNSGKIICDPKTGQIKYVLEGDNPPILKQEQMKRFNNLTSGGVLLINCDFYKREYKNYLEAMSNENKKSVSVYSGFIRWLVEKNEKPVYAYDVEDSVIDLGRPSIIR